MLELFYNSFDKFCDANKFDESEKVTDSLYLAVPEQFSYDCIQPGKMRKIDCRDSFKANAKSVFFPRTCCSIHKKNIISESWDFSTKNLDVQKYYVCVAKFIASMTASQIKSTTEVKF